MILRLSVISFKFPKRIPARNPNRVKLSGFTENASGWHFNPDYGFLKSYILIWTLGNAYRYQKDEILKIANKSPNYQEIAFWPQLLECIRKWAQIGKYDLDQGLYQQIKVRYQISSITELKRTCSKGISAKSGKTVKCGKNSFKCPKIMKI